MIQTLAEGVTQGKTANNFTTDVNQENLRNKRLHEARIQELESGDVYSSYSPELSEAYLGLADSLISLNEYANALAAYDRALQIVRISDGLYSVNQLPMLQAQLEVMKTLGDWHAFDKTSQLIFNIAQRNFPPGATIRVQALDQLGKWRLKAADDGLLEEMKGKAKEVAELYENEIRLIGEADKGQVTEYDIAALHLGKANAILSMVEDTLDKGLKEYQTTEMPSMKSYLNAANLKNREFTTNLENLRLSILDAAEILQAYRNFGDRDILMDEFRSLAETYTRVASLAPVI